MFENLTSHFSVVCTGIYFVRLPDIIHHNHDVSGTIRIVLRKILAHIRDFSGSVLQETVVDRPADKSRCNRKKTTGGMAIGMLERTAAYSTRARPPGRFETI